MNSSAQAAVVDMRATARWTIAANAAVGGLLLGGFPLAAIGKVHGAADIALAVTGLVLAVAGVSWAIWWTGEALSPRFVTLASLQGRALADLRGHLESAPEVFFGPFGGTADALDKACRLHATVAVRLADLLAGEGDEERRAELTHRLSAARTNAANAAARRRALLELIHAWEVRNALRRARVQTLIASLAIAAGAVLFLLTTGSR